jgi:hypothetical protein
VTDRPEIDSKIPQPGSRFTRNIVIGFAIIEAIIIFGALLFGRH